MTFWKWRVVDSNVKKDFPRIQEFQKLWIPRALNFKNLSSITRHRLEAIWSVKPPLKNKLTIVSFSLNNSTRPFEGTVQQVSTKFCPTLTFELKLTKCEYLCIFKKFNEKAKIYIQCANIYNTIKVLKVTLVILGKWNKLLFRFQSSVASLDCAVVNLRKGKIKLALVETRNCSREWSVLGDSHGNLVTTGALDALTRFFYARHPV